MTEKNNLETDWGDRSKKNDVPTRSLKDCWAMRNTPLIMGDALRATLGDDIDRISGSELDLRNRIWQKNYSEGPKNGDTSIKNQLAWGDIMREEFGIDWDCVSYHFKTRMFDAWTGNNEYKSG